MKVNDPYLRLVKPGICPYCHHLADDSVNIHDKENDYVYRCINPDCIAYGTAFSIPQELLLIFQILQDKS